MPQVDVTSILRSNSQVNVQKNVNFFAIIYNYFNYLAIVI